MNSFALRSASRPARHFPRNGRSFRGGSAFFSHPPHAARVLPEWGGVSSTSLPLSVQASSSSRCWSRRHLQNSGRGSVADHDREDVRASGRRVWRNSRGDGAGTTRAYHCASSTLRVIWTRSANSHQAGGCVPAASRAGQMTASDHAQQRPQRFPLPGGGRPQMVSCPSRFARP